MHLWSESYDRQLDNIFEVQSDVAQRIAQILQAEVSPEVKLRIESQPTRNSEAYDYYLKGLREGEKNYDKQLEYYEKAIEIDPDFAAAYSAVGRWKLNEGGWAGTLSAQEATDLALPYIEKAIVLDPYDAEAYLALADLALYFKWDFEEAGKNYQKAIELSPSDPMIQSGTSDYLLASGQSEIALLRNQRAIASGGGSYDGLALAQYFTDQRADALETIDTYLIVDNINNDAHMAARIYVGLNMYREVVELFENINPTDPGLNVPRTLGLYAVGLYHTGQLEKTNEVINILKQKSSKSSVGSPAFNLAIIYGHMGQIDTAFKWLEKGYDDHEVEMYWIKVEPALEPLPSDPRWQEMLDKVGFPK
jgi:tetratricopeptide (TPR) repeat protein